MELERQLEKQREIERQREEQRQKMMEQREVGRAEAYWAGEPVQNRWTVCC